MGRSLVVGKGHSLQGDIRVPGDKSISHRAAMLSALAHGESCIANYLLSADCFQTIDCLRKLGVAIEIDQHTVRVQGYGLDGLREPVEVLDVGNSGTTIRLLSGILAGQPFTSFITGDTSIRRRPMGRITKPLKLMGAQILGRADDDLAPLAIRGGRLQPVSYATPVASAQVKSAILLAGLFTDGWTEVLEPAKSRDHTELMLQALGVPIVVEGLAVRIKGGQSWSGFDMVVPGDLSSAAFWLVAGSIVPNSRLVLHQVGLNPTRTGIIDILRAMGAKITILNAHTSMGEHVGDLLVESSSLHGIEISDELVVRAIDEIPIVAVAAGFASGVTEIRDAGELKVKESNRLAAIAGECRKLGMDITELPDGLRIRGGCKLMGTVVDSHNDHRIALSLAVAALMAEGQTTITNAECINVSYPNFPSVLSCLGGVVSET